MRSLHLLLPLWTLVLYSDYSLAYWRMACSVAQTGRIDPIISPGTVSGHTHKLAGGSNINQNSDYYSLQSSTCSSCEIQKDKSAYWTPQLYFAHANGQFEEVPNYGMTVYYVGRGGTPSNTKPFPIGFKMLTGDSRQRSYDNTTLTYLNTRPVADRVSFRCINEANDIPEQHYMFQTDCVNGMRAQVNFQSCWDGVNNYLDNNAHVAYLSGIDYGVCPPSHPVPIPGLFFEVLYMTNLVDQSKGGQFVFSNGDATGYGFHGDFMNGWDMSVQTSAVGNCLYTDDGGLISACSYLSPSDDVNFSRNCPQQPPVFNEPVRGIISALAGCNPITYGPDPVPQVVCPLNSNTPGAVTTVSASSGGSSGVPSSIGSSSSSSPVVIGTVSSSALSSSDISTVVSSSETVSADSTSLIPLPPSTTSTAAFTPPVPSTSVSSDLSPISTSSLDTNTVTISSTSVLDVPSNIPTTFTFTSSNSGAPSTTPANSQNLPTTFAPTGSSSESQPTLPTSSQGFQTPGGIIVTEPTTTIPGQTTNTAPGSTDPAVETTSETSTTVSETSNPVVITPITSVITLTPSVTGGPAPGSALLTITITEWVTVTITGGSGSPGNFVTVSNDPNTISTASLPVANGEATTTLSAPVQDSSNGAGLSSASVITMSAVDGINGSPTSIPVTIVTTVLPGSTITESGTTVSVEGSTITQSIIPIGDSGQFYTITGSTYTTFVSNVGSAVVPEETSTTTIFTTTTLYVTVTPTSTLTIAAVPTTFSTSTSPRDASAAGSAVPSTLNADDTFACSLYAAFSIEGCPPSATVASSSTASTTADVATAFVTVTQPITEETTSTVETTVLGTTSTPEPTVFRIRGREFQFRRRWI